MEGSTHRTHARCVLRHRLSPGDSERAKAERGIIPDVELRSGVLFGSAAPGLG